MRLKFFWLASLLGALVLVSAAPTVLAAPISNLSVTIAVDTPAAATIISDSDISGGTGAQAMIPALKLTFSAGSAGDVKVTIFKLQRLGAVSDADIGNVYLYDGDTLLASNPSIADGYATFTSNAGLFTVGQNTSKTIAVKFDLKNNTTDGQTIGFGLGTAEDIVSDASPAAGVFPLNGNVFTTALVSDIGSLVFANVSPLAAGTVDPGTNQFEIWKFRVADTDQDVEIRRLKFTLVGSVNAPDLKNFTLWYGPNQLGSTVVDLASDKTVAFDLTLNPLVLTKGQIKNLSLKTDVALGAGHSFYAALQNAADIVIYDQNYGIFIKPNGADVFAGVEAGGDNPVSWTINAATVTLTQSLASDSPAGEIPIGGHNVPLAKFLWMPLGDDVELKSLFVSSTVGEDLDRPWLLNVRLLINGVAVGQPIEALRADGKITSGWFNFSAPVILPADTTSTLEITADLSDARLLAGQTLVIGPALGSSNAFSVSGKIALSTIAQNSNVLALRSVLARAPELAGVIIGTTTLGLQWRDGGGTETRFRAGLGTNGQVTNPAQLAVSTTVSRDPAVNSYSYIFNNLTPSTSYWYYLLAEDGLADYFPSLAGGTASSAGQIAFNTRPLLNALSTIPANRAVSVATNTWPAVDFTNPLEPDSVVSDNAQLRQYSNSAVVTTTLEITNGGRRIVFHPARPLAYGTAYYFFFGRGLRDIYGDQLEDPWYASEKSRHQFTAESPQAEPPVNQAPIITSSAPTTATVGQSFQYQIAASDADNDALRYKLTAGPSWLVLSSTTVAGTPSAAGSFTVAIAVADQYATTTQNFILTVAPPPILPTPTAPANSVRSVSALPLPANPKIMVAAVSLPDNTARLVLSAANNPAEYLFASSSNFSGAVWAPFISELLWNFGPSLSGTSTLYVKFRNNGGESGVATVSFSVTRTLARARSVSAANTLPTAVLASVTATAPAAVLGEKISRLDELAKKLSRGARGADVRELQQGLVRAGFMPRGWRVTNYFGPVTERAVIKQRAARTVAEASIKPDDTALKGLITLLKPGRRAARVHYLQKALKERGLFPAHWQTTGYYGQVTAEGVRRFNARLTQS